MWPIIFDTAGETSIFCSSTKRPDSITLHRENTHFYTLRGLRVKSGNATIELPPIPCMMSDQEYKDPSSIFEYSPLILGINYLCRLPQPLFVDYQKQLCGWGRVPSVGKQVLMKWDTPRNGLGNRKSLKAKG